MAEKQRYVIIWGQVLRWEEKSPFVDSGESVLGAIEYDRENDLVKCHECGKWMASIGPHLNREDHPKVREYKLRHGLRGKASLSIPSLSHERSKAGKLKCSMDGGRQSAIARKIGAQYRQSGVSAKKHQASAEYMNMKSQCRAQLLNRVKGIAADIGVTPMQRDNKDMRYAARANFGSWDAMLDAAGLPRNHGFTDQALVELLRDFYVTNGRLPRAKDWRSGGLPTRSTVVNHFGSLIAAYDACGLGGAARGAGWDARKRVCQKEYGATMQDSTALDPESTCCKKLTAERHTQEVA